MPLKFSKELIADERYESAAFIDVNNNGILDIVSGGYWYKGPDFKTCHRIGDVRTEGEYYDDFSNIPMDINGNGLTDYITGGYWGETVQWRENPGDPDREWPLHEIDKCGNIERNCTFDIDGDGELEIVPNCPEAPLSIYKLIKDSQGKRTGKFKKTVISNEPQGHGLGAGSIAGNDRMDIILNKGWLEAPENPYVEEWIWHPDFELFPSASVPILVVDVNGDGLNDIIVGGGHEYGLDWWEQQLDGSNRCWIRHHIDPFNSQYHDLKWIDIDSDGQCELVTGKRYRAHCGRDPGASDDYGCYYFKWTGDSFAKQVIQYGQVRGDTTGLGIYFDMVDLTGNGFPDILAPGKDGLYLLWNQGEG